MSPHAFVLLALLCSTTSGDIDACEDAEIRARDCAHAERWLRDGMRPGQTLSVIACHPAPTRQAEKEP